MNGENTTPLDGSAFARVLGRLMAAHLPWAVIDEEKALEVAEWSGLDPETFRARLHNVPGAEPGDLSQLAYELSLSGSERQTLAMAYAFEREPEAEPVTRAEMLEHLTERVGFTPEEAERVLRDDDLWVALPEQRLEVPDEQAVEEWREASLALGELLHVADRIGLGTLVAITDAQTRVEIALERAKERTGVE